MNTIFDKFQSQGAQFLIKPSLFRDKLHHIKVFIFDWDGVFTNGLKDSQLQSHFNESDSVGLNLLRFSYYLKYQEHPIVAFISGEKNQTAFTLIQREHIHFNYFKIPNKIKAFEHLCHIAHCNAQQTCFVFDDILDLSIAEKCGLRMYVKKTSAVLFNEYVIKNKLADYVTFSNGSQLAVREICELLMGLYDNFEDVIQHRIQYSPVYQQYLNKKRTIHTQHYSLIDTLIQPINI